MKKYCLPILLILCVCCCKTTADNRGEHVDNASTNPPSDVVVIKDSFLTSNDLYSSDKDFLVSRNYIGTRYVSGGDTIIEEPVFGLPPNVMKEIHSYGKDIIPYLISHIDTKQNGIAGFINPYDSNLGNKILGCSLGVNYAYMIELIMAKDTIVDNIHYAVGHDIWYEKMKPYQIYGQCVIIRKKDKDNPQKSEMTVDDLKTVKAIYNNWWESNKNEDLDSLRKKWREDGSPLRKSSFMWI